jgi:hypothetical protein
MGSGGSEGAVPAKTAVPAKPPRHRACDTVQPRNRRDTLLAKPCSRTAAAQCRTAARRMAQDGSEAPLCPRLPTAGAGAEMFGVREDKFYKEPGGP